MDINLWCFGNLSKVPTGKPAIIDGMVMLVLGQASAPYVRCLMLSGEPRGRIADLRDQHCIYFDGDIGFEVELEDLLARREPTNQWMTLAQLLLFSDGAFVNGRDRGGLYIGVSVAGQLIDADGLSRFHQAFQRWKLVLVGPGQQRTVLLDVEAVEI